MFFAPLAFLALGASAASVVHIARDAILSPLIATLNAITAELQMINSNVDSNNLNSASNTSAAFIVDGGFNAVNVITSDAGLQVEAFVNSFGVAAVEDEVEEFIELVNTTYVPALVSVLSRTIVAQPVFVELSLPGLDLASIILADLELYNDSNEFYLGLLTNATPPDHLPEVLEIRQVVTDAFNEVFGAYECPVASSKCAAAFGQCGGTGFTGPTLCVSGSVCTVLNAFFSQCIPTPGA